MKKFLVAMIAVLATAPAFAAQLDCVGVETEEWAIRGTFGGKTVEMFDNDNWATFNYKYDLESYPVQMVYQEEDAENTLTIRGTRSEDDKTTTAVYRSSTGQEENFTCEIK